jgi:hypothetical protein
LREKEAERRSVPADGPPKVDRESLAVLTWHKVGLAAGPLLDIVKSPKT